MADRHQVVRDSANGGPADLFTRDYGDSGTPSLDGENSGTEDGISYDADHVTYTKRSTDGYSNTDLTDTGYMECNLNDGTEQNAGCWPSSLSTAGPLFFGVVLRIDEEALKSHNPEEWKFLACETVNNVSAGGRPTMFMDRQNDTSSVYASRLTNYNAAGEYVWMPVISADASGFPKEDEFGNEYPSTSYAAGDYWDFVFNDYVGEYIYIECEWRKSTDVVSTTHKLYIYTQDGVFQGKLFNGSNAGEPLLTLESETTDADGNFITPNVMYWVELVSGSGASSNYDISSIDAATSFMGPPPGFVASGATPVIDADTIAVEVTGSDVELLPFVSTTPWLWGDGEAILWGDGTEVTYVLAYLRNWDTVSIDVTPSTLSSTTDYAIDAGSQVYYTLPWVVVLSGVNYTLNANPSSALVSPVQIPLQKDSVITAETTAFNATGSDVTLQYSSSIVIDVDSRVYGTIAWAVVLSKGWSVDADTDSYDVTGLDTDLSTSIVLQAGATAVNYTPSEVSLSELQKAILVNVARYNINGSDLTFSTSEDAQDPVFGKNSDTEIIKREIISTLVSRDPSSLVIAEESNTDTVEYLSSTYKVSRVR